MKDPVENAELLAFAKTVEAKSMSRAAAELGIPRATLSRRLARLEERLATRLLQRTTRSLTLTAAGAALYRHAGIVLAAVSDAEFSVQKSDSAPRGELRISVPTSMNQTFFVLICTFARQHPEVRMHVHFSSRMVDLRREGYDVALRASGELEPGLVARTLVRGHSIAVASPQYLAEKGTPRAARDLAAHRCLMGFARGELPETHWLSVRGRRLQVAGTFFSNEVLLLHEMALAGLGIAVLPRLVVQPSLQSGALVQVLRGVLEEETQIALVYPERKYLLPQVRAFVDAVTALAREEVGRGRPDSSSGRQAGGPRARPDKR